MKERVNFPKTRPLLSLRAAISLMTNVNRVLNAKDSQNHNEANDLCPIGQMAPLCPQTTTSLSKKDKRVKVRKTTKTKMGSSKKATLTKTKMILRSNSS